MQRKKKYLYLVMPMTLYLVKGATLYLVSVFSPLVNHPQRLRW